MKDEDALILNPADNISNNDSNENKEYIKQIDVEKEGRKSKGKERHQFHNLYYLHYLE